MVREKLTLSEGLEEAMATPYQEGGLANMKGSAMVQGGTLVLDLQHEGEEYSVNVQLTPQQIQGIKRDMGL